MNLKGKCFWDMLILFFSLSAVVKRFCFSTKYQSGLQLLLSAFPLLHSCESRNKMSTTITEAPVHHPGQKDKSVAAVSSKWLFSGQLDIGVLCLL
jgi:hypothetical protein